MSFLWLVVWLDYGTPQLHGNATWIVLLIAAILTDLSLKLLTE